MKALQGKRHATAAGCGQTLKMRPEIAAARAIETHGAG